MQLDQRTVPCTNIAACAMPSTCSLLCCLAAAPQERPEDIPTGELPRTLLMVTDRHLVGRITPGSRLVVTGIYCTHRWDGTMAGSASLGHACTAQSTMRLTEKFMPAIPRKSLSTHTYTPL
jgi:hypothetical protein